MIFAVNVWQPTGHEPESLWQVMARQKDIQYASRADSHIARQKQIHRLRHVIRELAKSLPSDDQDKCRELAAWGCRTTMHVVLDLIRTLYPLRTCTYNLSPENIAAGKFKVCLEYHLGNCMGPCEGHQSAFDYNENINQIKNLLRGNLGPVAQHFKSEMKHLNAAEK